MPKKTKAIKDSDKTKAWNRKKKPTTYKLDTIPVKKTILIVCEGQTEKLYFESFPVYGVKVEAIDLGGQSKTKLVETTVDIISGTTYINYEKDGKKYAFCQTIYHILANDKEASQSRAIKFAEEMYNKQGDLPYHQQNPVTTVFMLVQSLNENLRQ